MTSIHCPDCSTEVFGSERTCPNCNFPISKLRGLSSAILTKNAERVAGLIQLGADLNALDKNGRTPLMIAALIDDAEIVQMLLAAGARPEFVNKAGETALSVAKSKDVEKIIRRAIVVSRFSSRNKSTTEIAAPPIQPVQPVISEEVHLPEPESKPALTEAPETTSENGQIEETHPESVQEEQPLYEAPALDFDQPLTFTEVAVWENRTDTSFETAEIHETNLIETQMAEVAPIKEEQPIYEAPALDFDQSLTFTEVAAWENRTDSSFETAEIHKTNLIEIKMAEESPIKEEPALEFDDSFMFTEVSAWENRIEEEQTRSEVISQDTKDVTEEELFGFFPIMNQSSAAFSADEFYEQQTIKIREFNETAPIDLEPEKEPLPEYQQFGQTKEPRYFVPALIGICLLISFMVLTWPRSYKSPVPQATRSEKTVNQITKTEPQKPQPVQKNEIPIVEETKVFAETQPQNEIPIAEETKSVVETPSEVNSTIVTSSLKQKPKVSTLTMGEQEKIRLGRALNSQGFTLIKLGRPGEAIPVLERSLRSFPKGTKDVHYAYALFNLGVAWRKAGRPDIAIPILEKRIQIDNQRDLVARELNTARQEAKNAGFGNFPR